MAKNPQIELVLIRAASTEWEDAGRLQGRTDLPVSAGGAQSFAGSLEELAASGRTCATIYSGPDDACVTTARMVADAQGGAKTKVIPGLASVGFGLWQGLLSEELEQRHPRKYKLWSEDPGSVTPPEGEPLFDAEARLLAALAKIADKANGAPVGVVLHRFEFAVVQSLLDHIDSSEVWGLVEQTPVFERRTLPRMVFRELLGTAKAVA